MAKRKPITTTKLASARPLGFQGTSVHAHFPHLLRQIRSRFSESHASLFAEPVADTWHDTIDWYVSLPGPFILLSEAPEPQRTAGRQRLTALLAELNAYVAELKASNSAQHRTIIGNLELALQYPGEEDVYLVGEQPVLTRWGFAAGAAENNSVEGISRAIPKAPAIEPVAAVAAELNQVQPAPISVTPLAATRMRPSPNLGWLWACIAGMFLGGVLIYAWRWSYTPMQVWLSSLDQVSQLTRLSKEEATLRQELEAINQEADRKRREKCARNDSASKPQAPAPVVENDSPG